MKQHYSTHTLAPSQSDSVVLFDVVLQLSPDGDVGLHPVNVRLVPVRMTGKQDCLIVVFLSLLLLLFVQAVSCSFALISLCPSGADI